MSKVILNIILVSEKENEQIIFQQSSSGGYGSYGSSSSSYGGYSDDDYGYSRRFRCVSFIDFGMIHYFRTLANYLQTKRGVRVGARLDARIDSAEHWHRALQ